MCISMYRYVYVHNNYIIQYNTIQCAIDSPWAALADALDIDSPWVALADTRDIDSPWVVFS